MGIEDTAASTVHQRAEAQIQCMEVEDSETLSPEETRQLIHELRVHQTELKMQNEQLHRTRQESQRREAEVSALLEGSHAVLHHRDFQTAARSIFDSCKHLIGATGGYIALLTDDKAKNEVLFLDSGGLACTVDPALPMPIRGLREGVYKTGKSVYENDFSASEWTRFLPDGHVNLDNVLFAPLMINGIVVGLLGLANKPGGFTENDSRLASAFGGLAAIALLNSHTLDSLMDSEERFRTVAQTAGDAIIIADSSGNIKFCNRAMTAIFGYTPEEIMGAPLTIIMPKRFRKGHKKEIQRAASTGELQHPGKTVETIGLGKDGSEFPVELSLSTWKIRNDVFFTGILRDITERKQAEESLKVQDQFITTVFESLGHPLYVIDANDYTIKMANSVVYRDELPEGITCYALTHGRDTPCEGEEQLCPLKKIVETHEPVVLEHVHYNQKGDHRYYEVHSHPIFDRDGNVAQIIEYTMDITERKLAEGALRARTHELGERVKELSCLYSIAAIVDKPGISLTEILQDAVNLIPPAWQYPEITSARIFLEGQEFHTLNFRETSAWRQVANIKADGQCSGIVEVYYLEERPEGDEGPFLKEERNLLNAIAARLGKVIERIRAQEALQNAHTGLEQRVQQRTAELATANDELREAAIQNARLYEAELRARQIAEILAAASLALTRTLDLNVVLDTLLDYLGRLVPYDSACVVLQQDETHLAVRAARGYERWVDPQQLQDMTFDAQASSHVRALLDTKECVIIPDTRTYHGWEHCTRSEHVLSWLGVPLVAGERIIGFCGLDGTEVKHFTQEHVQLAEALISEAAIAIQNAWLFQQVRTGRERLQSLSRRLVEIQENERRYIARELHDEAGQALTSLMVGLRLLEREAGRPEAIVAGVAELMRTVDDVLENLHRLAMDLRPASLDHLGLVAALRQYIEAVSDQTGLVMQFETVGSIDRLRLDVETALYRIVQEGLTNVIRHARATRTDVLLERRDNKLIVIVEDNGIGFDPIAVLQGEHLGLIGLRERAEMLGGTLAVESIPDAGTTLLLEVPYVSTDTDRG